MSTKYIASNWRLPNKAGVDSYLNDNYGLTFDGSSEYITAGAIDITGDKSISVWFRTSNVSTVQGIIEIMPDPNTSDFLIVWIYNSKILVSANGVASDSKESSVLNSNTWYNLIITKSSSIIDNIYINGLNDTQSTTNTLGFVGGRGNTYIGATYQGTAYANELNGSISEVAIFDYTLLESQISTLYGSSSLGSASPLALKPAPVAYYPLGDNSSGNPLTQPNEAVEDASVFDFEPSETITTANSFTSIVTGSNVIGICTISYWLKVAGGSQQSFLELVNSATHTAGFRIDSNNKPYYINSQGGRYKRFTALSNPSDWNHWCWIFPSDTSYADAKLYINGVEKSVDFDFSAAPANNAWNGFYINKFQTGSSATFQMSNLQLWIGNLSESEVNTLYNSGVPLLTGTQPQASNLKAWYKLDQSANWDVSGSGYWDIPDASGNGNDGISSGMTSANLVLSDLTRNLPYDSYSFDFDGISKRILIGSSTEIDNVSLTPYSFSIWFKFSSSSNMVLCQKGITPLSNAHFAVHCESGSLTWYGVTAGITTSSAVNDGNWRNIVFVAESSTVSKIYLDGSLDVTSSNNKISSSSISEQLSIGAYATGTYDFDGKMSNVSIFDEALTSTEVMKLYSNGMPQDLSTFTPTPVAWWTLGSNSFFNGTNFICKDLSGNGNDGTSVNAGVDALVGDTPRSEANGVATNQSIPENLVGTTKYSSNNSYSINMSNTARVQDTP